MTYNVLWIGYEHETHFPFAYAAKDIGATIVGEESLNDGLSRLVEDTYDVLIVNYHFSEVPTRIEGHRLKRSHSYTYSENACALIGYVRDMPGYDSIPILVTKLNDEGKKQYLDAGATNTVNIIKHKNNREAFVEHLKKLLPDVACEELPRPPLPVVSLQ